jgi:hypothetical protein
MSVPSESIETIDIRPGVSVLSVLRHLNYQPWFALAEFVDNSLQSYLQNRDALVKLTPYNSVLHVSIDVETHSGGTIIIRDNAAGIAPIDFPRAFRTAEVPPDQSGLSEFGMGMKSAACWFASKWSVRTSALGDPNERTIHFDIDRIVEDTLQELDVKKKFSTETTHFTEVRLESLHNKPQSRTVSKIKDHLASIYRVFIRDGLLELKYNDELLTYDDPAALNAPYYKTPNADPLLWRKEINFDFGFDQRAKGFVAIREKASSSLAGLALFRRDRLIQGSGEDSYRPQEIFGATNSFRYQRIFGELHLEGFNVSHTKDGFQWAELEEPFLALLKEDLEKQPLPLLTQADGYRVKSKPDEWQRSAQYVVDHTAEVIQKNVPPILEEQVKMSPEIQPPPHELPSVPIISNRNIDIELDGQSWRIQLELSHDHSVGDWITVSDKPKNGDGGMRILTVRIALAHPFIDRFAGPDRASLEPLIRIAAGLALAETTARESGATFSGTIRRVLNRLLRDALSKV